MSRVLLTWELGLNLGHLTRLLPIAQRLQADGHTVLVATRDIQAAARVLAPERIPFVQAPHLPQGIPLAHRAAGYADILLSQGWSDGATLHALTHAWLNLFRLYNPDRLLLDYSPTVGLAARIAQLPALWVGNGFELPPATDPLPPFPGFSWATPARAAESEAVAVANANRVLSTFSAAPLVALRALFEGQTTLLATLPELDHYGARSGAHYIGPLLGKLRAPRVDWPQGQGQRIFACLRPDTCHAQLILSALSSGIDARVICVAAGFTAAQLEPFRNSPIRFVPGPVDLEPLRDAELCITYGAEGTMLRFLAAAVPQLISRWHVETYMAARRIEATGSGASFADVATEHSVRESILRLSSDSNMRAGAARVAQHLANYDAAQTVAMAIRNEPSPDALATEPAPQSIAVSAAPATESARVQ
jgi:UDP:flavonoid glycosyltransferase YjiC (YdhE family)